MHYVSDLITQEQADLLWEWNRLSIEQENVASMNMLELQNRKREGNFSLLNFSGMDLQAVPLYPYICSESKSILLPQRSELTEGLKLSMETFFRSGHTGPVTSIAISPDGKRCLTASDDLTIRLWDMSTGACLKTLDYHSLPIEAVAFLPDRKQFVSCSEGNLYFWNAVTFNLCDIIEDDLGEQVTDMLITREGKSIVCATKGGFLRVIDMATKKPSYPAICLGKEFDLFSLACFEHICVMISKGGCLQIIDLESQAVLKTKDIGCKEVTGIANPRTNVTEIHKNSLLQLPDKLLSGGDSR